MLKKRRPLLAAFCIPVAVMLAAIVHNQIYPFGDRSFLRVDMYNQYMPFFTELHRKLREGGSLFFSWRAGLGANFVALYAYYLASPVNWLVGLCPKGHIIEFMTALIVGKIGLCGLTFAWYLKRHFETDSYAVTLFAVFYALSGFLSAYNWNIMWLDCIFLAPVVMLGLEGLARGENPVFYCISLGLSILTNYYMSIFVCIFAVLYFIVLILWLPLREKGKRILNFICYSILAGGLAGVVLIPGTLALRATRFDQANFPKNIKFYFNLLQMLARHCVNVSTEIRNSHWPNLYCGVAVLFLLPLYVCCRKISWREKAPRLLLLGFFYLGFSVNVLEFLWHGLNFPDSLPARQSFLYIFLVLTLCFEAFTQLREIPRSVYWAVAGGAMLFLPLCYRFARTDDFGVDSYLFTALYLGLYAFLLYWHGQGSLRKNVAVGLLLCLVITESAMNTIQTSVSTTGRSQYLDESRANGALLESLEGAESGFSRVEIARRMTKNDGMLAGFPTATFFSSTVSEAVSTWYRKLGMSSSKVFYSHDGATPFTSALLSVGYMLSDSPREAGDFYKLIAQGEGKYLYQACYTLPLGFVVESDLEERVKSWEGGPIDVQNALAWELGVRKPLFSPVEAVCEDGSATVCMEEAGYLYVFPDACSSKNITANVASGEKEYEKVYYPHVLDIGFCRAGEEVRLTQSGAKRNERNELKVSAWALDLDALREAIGLLSARPMEVTALSDTAVQAQVDAGEGGLLVTSIPAEAGWKVEVDGERTAIRPFGGAMIGVELPAGSHAITLSYSPPGLVAGAVVSAFSALALWVCQRGKARTRKRAAR